VADQISTFEGMQLADQQFACLLLLVTQDSPDRLALQFNKTVSHSLGAHTPSLHDSVSSSTTDSDDDDDDAGP